MSGFELTRVSERALRVRFDDDELEVAVARARAFAAALEREGLPARGERVLGAGNVLVLFEHSVRSELADLAQRLHDLASSSNPTAAPGSAPRRIEVDYGGEAGPDLGEVAATLGMAPDRVVELHSGAHFSVAFLGFSPGFAYLIGLPRELELPRQASPRSRVPAGSVAIAGSFSAIYPSATPGGWHLLGRTRLQLFDPAARPPALLAPGEAIRFVAR